jgi:hypothetical protein
MTSEPQELKAILCAVFRRNGANGSHTRLFDDLDPAQQQVLLQHVDVRDELPVIGSVEALGPWFLLTTKKLTWSRGNAATTLSIDNIVDTFADLNALRESRLPKSSMRELQITTTDGQYTIEAEPGAPLSGLWNVLKSIGVSNRHRAAPR